MGSNNFDGHIILDGNGDYIGFRRAPGTAVSTGARVMYADTLAELPVAPAGSFAMLGTGTPAYVDAGGDWVVIPTSSSAPSAFYLFIDSKDDLPAASGGIITLEASLTYLLTTAIDLTGDRIVAGSNTVILGASSENSSLTSTGLVGQPLITSTFTLPMRHFTIKDVDIALALDATGDSTAALDWTGLNFSNCTVVGTITEYANVIITMGAFLSNGSLTFDGTFGTVAFINSLLVPNASTIGVVIASTAVIDRRVRFTDTAIVAGPASSTGIDVESLASFGNDESFIVSGCNFSGSGTYLTGISSDDNEALIESTVGIPLSANVGQYTMAGNAVATATTPIATFVKAAGTTVAGSADEKFDVTTVDNRATYIGALTGLFLVVAYANFTGSANQEVAIRIAKNGTPDASVTSLGTTNSGGRSENTSISVLESLTFGDYIEIFIANDTSTSSITVTDLNVIVYKI